MPATAISVRASATGTAPLASSSVLGDVRLEPSEILGGGGSVSHVSLGETDASHLRRGRRGRRLGSHDELGAPAADVEHGVGRRRRPGARG